VSKKSENVWGGLMNLGAEMKKCDEGDLTTASIDLAFICIDTLANLSRPEGQDGVRRADFIRWVDTYLKGDPEQNYQYRGKDVYAARCAYLHTYGSEASLHKTDTDTKKFGYSNGGEHMYNSEVDQSLVIIGARLFISDLFAAIVAFMKECEANGKKKKLVEDRLPKVLNTFPVS
jgi:hypothetical protein